MKIDDAKRLYNELKNEYDCYKSNLKSVRDYICPNRARFDDDNRSNKNKYDYSKIITNTALKAAKTFAKGVCNGLMPRDKKWIGYKKNNYSQQAKKWLENAERTIMQVFKSSKLYTLLPLMILDNKIFGYSALGVFRDYQKKVKFALVDIGSYFYSLDEYGEILHFARHFTKTAFEFKRDFPENIPQEIEKALKEKDFKKRFLVYQIITPKPDDQSGKKYLSLYFLKDGKSYLRKSGFDYFPFIVSIVDRANDNNIYGSSAGIDSLGNIRMLQKMQTMSALGVEKIVKPPVSVNSDSDVEEINLLPDGITRITGNNAHAGVEPIYKGGIDITSLEYKIEQQKAEIVSDFEANLFISATPQKQMTAEEVASINAERVVQFSSIFNTYTSEFCEPLVNTVFNILYEGGVLGVMPDELAGEELEFEYYGDLAKYENLAKAQNLERFSKYLFEIAKERREVLDLYSMDQIVKKYAEYLDIESDIENNEDDVAMARKARTKIQQEAKNMADVQQALGAMNALSKMSTGADSALGTLIGKPAAK